MLELVRTRDAGASEDKSWRSYPRKEMLEFVRAGDVRIS